MGNHVTVSRIAGMALALLNAATIVKAEGARKIEGSRCPLHTAHTAETAQAESSHGSAVDQRHDSATGVHHADSVHHFILEPRGGTILLDVRDPQDALGRDRIRVHLSAISRSFARGDFALPMLIHDRTPPGVPAMKEAKGRISYTYEPTERGGRVLITTEDPKVLAAIHAFLRFQIQDHRTGDPLEISAGSVALP